MEELKGKIIIGYYSLAGFFTQFVVTNHRYIDDLEIDLKRMVKTCDDKILKMMSRVIIYAVGEINDESGEIVNYPSNKLLVQFTEYVEEAK